MGLGYNLQKASLLLSGRGGKHFERGIEWIKKYRLPNSGIRVDNKTELVTQEVTGYTIPTLMKAGEKDLAFDLARWEASVQQSDGSFTAPGGVPYTFDTAQVIRGFLAVHDELPGLEKNLRRACDYVESQIDNEGKVLSVSYDTWKLWDGDFFTEYTHLYVLPPLLQAGKKLGEQRYVDAALRGMDYFREKEDLVEFKPKPSTISHVFGYMMEALVELEEIELAKKGLAQAAKIQKSDGAIPAYPGVDWVCSTGIAQLAVAFYKVGERDRADKAVDYLEKIQNRSGGFYGSYGKGAKYNPNLEVSWAVKFFLDAYMLKHESDFKER